MNENAAKKLFNTCRMMAAFVLCSFLLYHVPLQSRTFCYDDHDAIVNNPVIRHLDLPRIFAAFNSRFLVGLSFALNYRLNALHPEGFRSVNLLIHCFNALLVYLLAGAVFQLSSFPARCRAPAALFAAFLFLCHPIQTEAVNFITQRFVLMGAFFYLLAVYLYVRHKITDSKRYWLAAMAPAVAAMFCKEFTVTLPLMLALLEACFPGPVKEAPYRRWVGLVPFFVVALIVPLMLLRTSPQTTGVASIAQAQFVQQGPVRKLKVDLTRAQGSLSRGTYFLTELNVMRTYVRLLFLPFNQNFCYDYPLSARLDARTLLSAAFLLGLMAIAGLAYRRSPVLTFGIWWFFIALSVESSLIPIGHVIAEYRLYLPSVGFVFAAAALLYERQAGVRNLNLIAMVIVAAFAVLGHQRNKVWKDDMTLWKDAARKSPHSPKPYSGMGDAYLLQGKTAEAIAEYQKALAITPQDPEEYMFIGSVYKWERNYVKAISYFTNAIGADPQNAKAYINRACVYFNLKEYALARQDFDKAVRLLNGVAPNFSNEFYAICRS